MNTYSVEHKDNHHIAAGKSYNDCLHIAKSYVKKYGGQVLVRSPNGDIRALVYAKFSGPGYKQYLDKEGRPIPIGSYIEVT